MYLFCNFCITLYFGTQVLFTGVSAFTAHESELIVTDLTSDIIMEHHSIRQLSPKCWIHALEVTAYENDDYDSVFSLVKVSSGTKFCSFLDAETKKYFSLALTKCHFDESGRNRLPLECYSSSDSDQNMNIRNCTSLMSEESFLVYTKFLLHVDQICTKLTGDLKIQEQKIAADKFQQSAFEMQKKIEESFQMQDELQKKLKDQYDLMSLQKDFSKTMQVEMEDILRNLSQQQEYVSVQQDAIAKIKDLYRMSGIDSLQKRFRDMKDLVASFYMWFRYVCILSVVATSCFISKRLRRARTFVLIIATLEVILEWTVLKLEKIDLIHHESGAIIIESLRSHDLYVYVFTSVLLVLFSFGKRHDKNGGKSGMNSDKEPDKSVCSDARISVDLLKENMMRERELYQIRHEQFQRQISELQRQLEASSRNVTIASQLYRTQSSCVIPSVMNKSLENDVEFLVSQKPWRQRIAGKGTQSNSSVVSDGSPNIRDINIHNDFDAITPSPSAFNKKRKSCDDESDKSVSFNIAKKGKR